MCKKGLHSLSIDKLEAYPTLSVYIDKLEAYPTLHEPTHWPKGVEGSRMSVMQNVPQFGR